MKKQLATALLLLIAVSPLTAIASQKYATLINSNGKKVVVVSGSNFAKRMFGQGYKLMNNKLGAVVSTGYSSKTSLYLSSINSTITVATTNDINGIKLPLSASNPGYFNLEPGTARQEPVMCTGATATTFTGCIRGLVATGYSNTGSSTLAFAHNAGSAIIMSNVSQFYGNFVNLTDDQTIAGAKTFASSTVFGVIPTIPTTTPTLDQQAASKKYVDTVGAGGFTAANASSTQGLQVFGTAPETIGVKASSTGGIGIGATGIYVKASSTGLITGTNGLDLNYGGDLTWTGTTTFSKLVSNTGTSTGFFGNKEYITSSKTWNRPAGVTKVRVILIGAGGSGGANTTNTQPGAGGGAGAYAEKLIDISATSSIYVTIGTANTVGTGQVADGATSSFSTFFSAGGGKAGAIGATRSNGGAGGIAVNGDININGSNGGASMLLSNSDAFMGEGGASIFGGAGASTVALTNPGGQGISATGYGSGGSGALYFGGGNGVAGSGKDGVCIIYY